ncbi:MAG TPA: alkaline phosphatase family protein, partial [Thermoanaerobaculia bacterium]|nr:alkaline phosphatase family protein [Thermoanaerobaculia bacterium]
MSATNGRAFDRVVIIIFENEYRNYVRQNPYMRTLAARGIEMANYFGVMHPSNTNYVASIAGEICNSSEDPSFYTLMPAPPLPPPPTPLTQRPFVDLIEGRGLSWNAYMDSYKPVEFPPQLTPVMSKTDPTKVDQPATVKHTILDYPPYLNMHNPFVRFQSIMENKDQWTRIKTANDFLRDALNNALPEYSWFTPDIWDDGHWLFGTYTEPGERGPVLVNQLSKWLESFFGILSFPGPASRIPPGTLVVVTFDESDFNQSYETIEGQGSDYDGPNQIYTVLLGDMIKPGIEQEGYNHYSLLKTIERNFGLGDLGKNDAGANWFQFLWGERFHWNTPAATPVTAAGALAAEGFEDALYVVYGGAGGSLS